jgi:hypothetical protein
MSLAAEINQSTENMSHGFFTCAVALTVMTQHPLFSASFDWPQNV